VALPTFFSYPKPEEWGFFALVYAQKCLYPIHSRMNLGVPMKKLLVVICSAVLAFGLAGCIGKGKAPVGKGKAPVVQTRG
jgi:hypothetical protein